MGKEEHSSLQAEEALDLLALDVGKYWGNICLSGPQWEQSGDQGFREASPLQPLGCWP